MKKANGAGRTACWLGALALAATCLAGAADAAPKVTVTSKPIHALVAEVMGETGRPALIVSGAASPHTYAMRPSDAKLLADADVVFRISEAIEPFTAKAVRSLAKTVQVVTLAAAPGVRTLPARKNANFEQERADAHGHDHAPAAAGRDPHVWLDPDNAKAMVDHIATVLAAKDPAQGTLYAANALVAKARIDRLAADLARDLAPLAGRPYVVFHDATQYLEVRYGLKPVGAFVLNPEAPASGKRLTDLRKRVQSLGATCVFAEPGFAVKVIESVVEGTPARTGLLDPEGLSLTPGRDLYDELMRGLAAGLRSCLLPAA